MIPVDKAEVFTVRDQTPSLNRQMTTLRQQQYAAMVFKVIHDVQL